MEETVDAFVMAEIVLLPSVARTTRGGLIDYVLPFPANPIVRPCCAGVGPLFATGGSGTAGASATNGCTNLPMSMVTVSFEHGFT